MRKYLCFLFLSFIALEAMSQDQTPPPPPLLYGEPIKLEQAEKVMGAALQEANKNNWLMAIAIVDRGGNKCYKLIANN